MWTPPDAGGDPYMGGTLSVLSGKVLVSCFSLSQELGRELKVEDAHLLDMQSEPLDMRTETIHESAKHETKHHMPLIQCNTKT